MPDLRLLNSFVAVVEEGSISAGARRIGVTQPAMTRQMQALEEELGLRLLLRGEGGRTTPAGARFYERVTNLLTQVENVIGRTKQEAEQQALTLHVIAPSATIDYGIARFLQRSGADGPILDCEAADPFRVFEVAAARGADLGISSRPPRAEWARLDVGHALLYAHVRSGHPLADRVSIEVDELITHPLVLLTPNNAARRVLDAHLPPRGYGDHVVVRHPAIAESLAIASPRVAVLTDLPTSRVHAIPITENARPLSVPLTAGWDPRNAQAELIESTVKRLRTFLHAEYRRRLRRLPRPSATDPDDADARG